MIPNLYKKPNEKKDEVPGLSSKNVPFCEPINDAVMTGKSIKAPIAQSKKLQISKEHSSLENVTDRPNNDLPPSVVQKDEIERKPAILVSSNTTKSLKLERRKVLLKKKVNIPKSVKKRDKVAGLTRSSSHHSEPLILKNSSESLVDTSLSPLPVRSSTSDIGASVHDKLKQFEEMDNEFYNIMKEMNIEPSQESQSISEIDLTDSERNSSAHSENQNHLNVDNPLILTELQEKSLLHLSNDCNNNLSIVNLKIKSTENILKTISTNRFLNMKSKEILKDPTCETNEKPSALKIEDGNCNDYLDIASKGNSTNTISDIHGGDFNNDDISTGSYSEGNSSIANAIENEENLVTLNDSLLTQKYNLVNRLGKKERPDDFKSKKGFITINKQNNTKSANSNIHHFCTLLPTTKLDFQQKLNSQFAHTPAKYNFQNNNPEMVSSNISSPFHNNTINESNVSLKSDACINEDASRYADIASRIIAELEGTKDYKETSFLKLQEVVNQMFEQEKNTVFADTLDGHGMKFQNDMTKHIHAPPPPKFHLPPDVIVEALAPDYVSKVENEDMLLNVESNLIEVKEADIIENVSLVEKEYRERIINRRHQSLNDLHIVEDEICLYEDDQDDDDEQELQSFGLSDRFESILDIQRRKKKIRPRSAQSFDYKSDLLERRCTSQPNFITSKPVFPKSVFASDFETLMNEMEEISIKVNKMKIENSKKVKQNESVDDRKNEKVSQHKKEKIADLKECIKNDNVRFLTRCQSYIFEEDARENKTLICRCKSLTDISEYNSMVEPQQRKKPSDFVIWLKENFWYKWLDEIYLSSNDEECEKSVVFTDDEVCSSSLSSASVDNEINIIADCNKSESKVVQKEIDKLSEIITELENKSASSLLGFHLCRRGACYKKIGDIQNSLKDLNRAIQIEPKLLDSYWHRHIIYLIQNNVKKALGDLNHITTYNLKHTNAFRSKAEIYKKKGEIPLAITNYSQAIHSNKMDAALYYARAALLEQRGDIILALEDYKWADQIEPSNTSAILKIAEYHFKVGSWIAASSDYTELIKREPLNGNAYLFRARSYAKTNHYEKAISDLSICINLQPNNYLAFYHRGCLLRKYRPQQALQDLCVSLLLESSITNINSYLHRAILYTDMNMFDQATTDFEVVIRLNRNFAPAHVNLGLIEMNQNKNCHLAIKRFNFALRVDATYIRAMICRAEAYDRINEIDSAINDYTRAILMNPNNVDYRMARGRLLLKKGQFELASFHIRQCAAMNTSKVGLSTQQAVVETFLKNYDKAINILEVAVKSQPIVHLYTLLGKTLMKAQRYHESIAQLNEALELMRPWNTKSVWPVEASETFFLIGMCFVELKVFDSALDAFNSAVKINSDYPQAYYQRGLVRMKLGLSKGVHDFNKALACQPTFYQAYLARATYYSMNGRCAKAIMNCNEAVRITPKSVRGFLYRGAIKYNIKAYGLAIKDISEAIAIDCNCWLAYFNRAVCYHEKKFYFKAIKDYSLVLMSDSPLKMKALLNRGLLYYEINDVNNAVFDFKTALEDDPFNVNVNHALGLCYQRIGKTSLAIEAYTNVLHIDPFCIGALIGRGNVISKNKENGGMYNGRKDFVRALHLNPLSTETRVNLAFSLQLEGRYMKAWNLFTKTLEINPNYTPALEGRALVSLKMGNNFGAFTDINAAVKIERSAHLLTNRGIINQCLGDVRSAMNDYQMAIRVDPSFSLAYYNAANVYFMHRQFAQAISYYTGAINWNPNDCNAYLNRAVAKTIIKSNNGQRDIKGAIDDFLVAEKLAPSWSHIYFNRGNLFYSVKRFEEAEKEYSKGIFIQPNSAVLHKKRADTRGKLGLKDSAIQDYRISLSLFG